MKKLFKSILVSTFAIGASLFIGNNVFAENYKVNIAVVGDLKTGKTQIINRILGDQFEDATRSLHTNWRRGAGGKIKQYHIGGDVFECKYYDAPGYIQRPDATIDQQIDSAAIRNAHIALIVVDPQQTAGIAPCYQMGGSISEAFTRHASHVFEVNPDCRIIVVANKLDEMPNRQVAAKYRNRMEAFKLTYDHLAADSIFTSALTGDGIRELEGKIVNLLTLNKAQFPTFDNRFVDCKNCGRSQRVSECAEGYTHYLYCCDGCLKDAEAKSCERDGCPNKESFLRCRGEGFTDPRTGKMYCDHDTCYRLAVGDRCMNPQCPHPDERYLRDEQQGFVSQHTNRMYCDDTCYKQGEGRKCARKGCNRIFVIADGTDGVDFFTNPKSGEIFCPEHRGVCTLL